MLRVYRDKLVGPAPHFPREIEEGIDEYLATQALQGVDTDTPPAADLDGGLIALPVELSDACSVWPGGTRH